MNEIYDWYSINSHLALINWQSVTNYLSEQAILLLFHNIDVLVHLSNKQQHCRLQTPSKFFSFSNKGTSLCNLLEKQMFQYFNFGCTYCCLPKVSYKRCALFGFVMDERT